MDKFEIYVRDLTVDKDFTLYLPCDDLEEKLNKEHEYIIIDGDIECGEYYNIRELNDFLVEADENGVDKETISILQVAFLWNEVVEMVKKDTYTLINFDAETSDWGCGELFTIVSEDNLGRCMYDLGYNMLPCEVPEELEDYIEWEQNWYTLESMGWTTVIRNMITYIVHR